MGVNTENDRLAKTLKFQKITQRQDFAEVAALVEDAFLNGIDLAHGGFLFSLCDYTVALAANTPERKAISSSAAIEFVNPVPPQTKLLATCTLICAAPKSGYYETRVCDESGKTTYCVFHSRAIYKPI